MAMRGVLWLVALCAVVWCGYWYYGARALRQETEAALATLKAEGRADYSALHLGGFPGRFDLTVSDPVAADPGGRWLWRGPQLSVHALAYNPGHVIVALPAEQSLTLGGETLALTTTEMRASAAFGLSSDLRIDHAEAVGGPFRAEADAGWSVAAEALRLAIRTEDATEFRYRIGAEAPGLTVTGAPSRALASAGIGEGPGRFRLDADLSLDRPLDRDAALAPPRLAGIDIRALEFDWGGLSLRGDGAVRIDGAGVPDGTVTLRLRNWAGVPALLVASGVIAPGDEASFAATLDQLAALSGSPDELALPLSFSGGWVALGPLPLGPAPRF